MKNRNRRLIQVLVVVVLGFFLLSTIGLSLISLTYTNVQAPTDEDIVAELQDVEIMTGDTELTDGVVVTGSFE